MMSIQQCLEHAAGRSLSLLTQRGYHVFCSLLYLLTPNLLLIHMLLSPPSFSRLFSAAPSIILKIWIIMHERIADVTYRPRQH